MPWKAKTARTYTRKAKTSSAKRLWAAVANSVEAKTHDPGRAVRAANKAVQRRVARQKGRGK